MPNFCYNQKHDLLLKLTEKMFNGFQSHKGSHTTRSRLSGRSGSDLEVEVRRLHRLHLPSSLQRGRRNSTIWAMDHRTQLATFCEKTFKNIFFDKTKQNTKEHNSEHSHRKDRPFVKRIIPNFPCITH
jgi:hypothetical protein